MLSSEAKELISKIEAVLQRQKHLTFIFRGREVHVVDVYENPKRSEIVVEFDTWKG